MTTLLSTEHKQLTDIQHLLSDYFDGLYRGDVALLKQVFHPLAHYSCASGNELDHLDMPAYFQWVANRPSPASRGQPRHDRVLSIDLAGPETALVKVNCAIGDRYFTDYLNLIWVDDRWWIIAKVFRFEAL